MEFKFRSKKSIEDLEQEVSYSERVRQIMNQIHAARDLDQIFIELKDEILSLFDAEHLTLYAVDYDRKEIYSRFLDLDTVQEIRVPINDHSTAGFVARNRRPVNIADAYDKAELARISPSLSFNSSWDKKTGVRTTQILAVPALSSNNLLAGVIQLINRTYARRQKA